MSDTDPEENNEYDIGEEIAQLYEDMLRVRNLPPITHNSTSTQIEQVDPLLNYPYYEMRRALTVGSPVKISKTPTWYKDTLDVAKKLGSTELLNAKEPKQGDTGEVIGVDEGYVLVKFEGSEALLDGDCLDKTKRLEEIKFVVKYPNQSIEEFSDEKEVEVRIRELYTKGHLKIGDEIKSYQVAGVKSIKVKVEISFT